MTQDTRDTLSLTRAYLSTILAKIQRRESSVVSDVLEMMHHEEQAELNLYDGELEGLRYAIKVIREAIKQTESTKEESPTENEDFCDDCGQPCPGAKRCESCQSKVDHKLGQALMSDQGGSQHVLSA